MHLANVRLNGFKRFTNTTITDIPASAQIVVLAGPNGSGKSSLFDGFRTWHSCHGGHNGGWDENYGTKVGSEGLSWTERVNLDFHEGLPTDADDLKKLFYFRSAFRNEADFTVSSIERMPSPFESLKVLRLMDNDASVSDNYRRLLFQSIEDVFSSTLPDTTTKAQIRDKILGEVRKAMLKVFPDLVVTGFGNLTSGPRVSGTFLFDKGNSSNFMYKNLSAGEKAAFDLILDAVVKSEFFDNSIWCIDEPESHLNTRLQARLMSVLVDLLPDNCQLWLASHSIGFMSEAWKMAKAEPDRVTFIDMQNLDFDSPVNVSPIVPSRKFWEKTLDVALGDVASLVAPLEIILCEGKPQNDPLDHRASFDASCYREIFTDEFPNTDFLSIGGASDIEKNNLDIGRAITAIAGGTSVVRLRDRDMSSPEEVKAMKDKGIRVLSRRNIESYLLDDNVIRNLCNVKGHLDKIDSALQIKADGLAASISRGHDVDDLKKAASQIYNGLRTLLSLTSSGNDWEAFAKGTMAPLLEPHLQAYKELRNDIFGL